MSNSASLIVRCTIEGKRKNLSPEEAKRRGEKGVFYMRTWEGGREKWKSLGTDPSLARVAVIRQKQGSVVKGSQTVREAIDAFILERQASQDANSVRRWKWELNKFEALCGKTFLKDIDRADVYLYWNAFKQEGAAPRTIYNRVQALLTFLKSRKIVGLLDTMPSFEEKPVDYYTEKNPIELDVFFEHCTAEEKIQFMFFLYSGCREREVMHACWNDIDFRHRTYTVCPKPELGFRTKNGGVRLVPLSGTLMAALESYRSTLTAPRRLVFVNKAGKPEGHFLYACKQVALRAGLNCGYCVNKQGLSCKTHPVCKEWSLHKFRRTWATMHLLAGTPITLIQYYIGHSDLETLNRYLAHISAKTDLAKKMADNAAKMMNTQGGVAADLAAELVKV